jgi:hypothetical protein
LTHNSFWLGQLTLLLLVSNLHASISFSYVGVVQGPVSANSTVTVKLYLQEVVTSQNTSLIASEGGLYAGAVALQLSSGTGATIIGASVNAQTEPNGFTGNNHVFIYNFGSQTGSGNNSATATSGNQATIVGVTQQSANIPPGPSGTTTGGSINSGTTLVWLGSVNISVGSSANAVYTVSSLKNAAPGTFFAGTLGNTLTATNFYDLDANSTNPMYTGATSTTFSVATSSGPEPSSMLLCGFVAIGMGFGAWRRRKLKLQAEVSTVDAAQGA